MGIARTRSKFTFERGDKLGECVIDVSLKCLQNEFEIAVINAIIYPKVFKYISVGREYC